MTQSDTPAVLSYCLQPCWEGGPPCMLAPGHPGQHWQSHNTAPGAPAAAEATGTQVVGWQQPANSPAPWRVERELVKGFTVVDANGTPLCVVAGDRDAYLMADAMLLQTTLTHVTNTALYDGRCPMDGKPVYMKSEPDEDREYCFMDCGKHQWPMTRDHGEWVTDEEKLLEQLGTYMEPSAAAAT